MPRKDDGLVQLSTRITSEDMEWLQQESYKRRTRFAARAPFGQIISDLITQHRLAVVDSAPPKIAAAPQQRRQPEAARPAPRRTLANTA